MHTTKALEMVSYQDKRYYVYRKISKNRIKEDQILNVKELWHCDIVLRTKNQEDEMLIFLVEMPDAVIQEN
jgi:hypothetical protein